MNKMTATGNIGRDAEVRTTGKGTTVASFSLAVASGYGDNAKTVWYSCSIFGKRAEGGLVKYLVKGQKVLVTGEPSLNQYTTKDGEHRAEINIFVDDVELLGGKAEAKPATPVADDLDMDIPF